MAKNVTKKIPAKTKTSPVVRKSGPDKGISRSPYAVYERGLRDLELHAQKLQRQGERLQKDDKASARKILATAKGLTKLIEKGAFAKKSKAA